MGECRLHRRPDDRLRHALGKRIDGQPIGGVRLLLAREPADLGVAELPDQSAFFGHTRDHDPHAGGEATVHEGHVEPDAADAAILAGQQHGQQRPAAGGCPGGDARHLAGDRGVLSLVEVGDSMGPAEIPVLTGKVHEGVRRRHQFQLDELLRTSGADAGQTLQRCREAPRAVGVRGWRLTGGWRSIHVSTPNLYARCLHLAVALELLVGLHGHPITLLIFGVA